MEDKNHRWLTGLLAVAILFLLASSLTACQQGVGQITVEAPPVTQTAPEVIQPEPETSQVATEIPPTEPAATETPLEVLPTLAPVDPVIGLELVAEGLTAPLALVEPEDGTGRLFILDQLGIIRILNPDGTLAMTSFLDITDQVLPLNSNYDERGLLGLAFHPRYAENGLFYVYYSARLRDGAPEGWDHTSRVSEFRVSAENPGLADRDSERILMEIDQPQGNHNGGQIAFGPDGYLYIPLGDGGGGNDVGQGHVEDWYEANQGGNGQDIQDNLLGSILRIDVDSGDPYAIPSDNPFANGAGLPEIYAYGFRNPYRISFDAGGQQQLFAGDAGQSRWEEVDLVVRGGNYGWNVREGAHCFDAANPSLELEQCPENAPDGAPLIDPVIEYPNSQAENGVGTVVIGGYVYRGESLPQFQGRYIFGDWSASSGQPAGTLFVAAPSGDPDTIWTFEKLRIANSETGELGAYLLSFGQDANRELYVLTSERTGPRGNTGRVYRIVPGE